MTEDCTSTGMLFHSPKVTDIRIKLQFGAEKDAPGHPGWVYIDVLDTFLEVDLAPETGQPEGLTLRIDGQKQRFYFRKGKTPENTDSETWYIVEWIDFGFQAGPEHPAGHLLVENSTWSRLKALFLK